MAASFLTKIGMLKAKERGVHVGRPMVVTGLEFDFAKTVIQKNPFIGVRELGAHLGINPGTAWRLKRKFGACDVCFNCGKRGECHLHHVVPKSLNGDATIPLCLDCHGLVHDRKMASSVLTRIGMAKAKLSGVRFGRQTVVTEPQRQMAREMIKENPDITITKLSESLDLSLGTASRLKHLLKNIL
jgi:hypothetical protein